MQTSTVYKIGYETSPEDYSAGDYDGKVLADRMQTPSAVQTLNHLRSNQSVPQQLKLACRNHARLTATDFPVIFTPIDIMSMRLVEVIQALGPINWVLIPAVFVDENSGRELSSDFKAVYFREFGDYFDRERSEFEAQNLDHIPPELVTENMRQDVRLMHKLVLRAPEHGLPPLFRLTVYPMALYASEACRTTVMQEGFRGIRFDACGEVLA